MIGVIQIGMLVQLFLAGAQQLRHRDLRAAGAAAGLG
jgi:hypothetical protein